MGIHVCGCEVDSCVYMYTNVISPQPPPNLPSPKHVHTQVIMATNRSDTLDPALLRPGRLDRKIEFPMPDRRQKRLIFSTITSKMNLSEEVDLEDCIPQGHIELPKVANHLLQLDESIELDHLLLLAGSWGRPFAGSWGGLP